MYTYNHMPAYIHTYTSIRIHVIHTFTYCHQEHSLFSCSRYFLVVFKFCRHILVYRPTNSVVQDVYLKSWYLLMWTRNYVFMKPESLVWRSNVSFPVTSSSYMSFSLRSILIISSYLCPNSQVLSSFAILWLKFCVHLYLLQSCYMSRLSHHFYLVS